MKYVKEEKTPAIPTPQPRPTGRDIDDLIFEASAGHPVSSR